MESKMAMAKRQKRKSPRKRKERKSEDKSENVRWNKQRFWPAHFTQGRLRGGEKIDKSRSKTEPLSSLGRPASPLKDVCSFACQIKLSCNQAVTLVCHFKFLVQWGRTEETAHSPQHINNIINCGIFPSNLVVKRRVKVLRINSVEKTLVLGKTESKRRRGWKRMRWLDGITNSTERSLSKLWEIERTGELGVLQSLSLQRVRHDLAREQQLVVKTLHFQPRGHRFDPWSGY